MLFLEFVFALRIERKIIDTTPRSCNVRAHVSITFFSKGKAQDGFGFFRSLNAEHYPVLSLHSRGSDGFEEYVIDGVVQGIDTRAPSRCRWAVGLWRFENKSFYTLKTKVKI